MSDLISSYELKRNAAFRGSRILAAVDTVAALYVSFRQWRGRRRTHKALADLNDRQLHDIGLERDDAVFEPVAWWRPRRMTYRALAELADADARHLSEAGRLMRREAMQHLEKTGDRR